MSQQIKGFAIMHKETNEIFIKRIGEPNYAIYQELWMADHALDQISKFERDKKSEDYQVQKIIITLA